MIDPLYMLNQFQPLNSAYQFQLLILSMMLLHIYHQIIQMFRLYQNYLYPQMFHLNQKTHLNLSFLMFQKNQSFLMFHLNQSYPMFHLFLNYLKNR